MPHAESPTNMIDGAMTNGHKNQSQFINHVKSYPVVSDGIKMVQENPYGAKSLEVADATYSKFGKPLEPYLEGPYSYAKPYVQKVDSMADKSLDTVDSHFPIVTEDTNTVINKAMNLVMLPFSTTGRVYHYAMSTWDDQYKKTANHNNRGPGITTSVMAIISTELKIASDCLQMGADILGRKQSENSGSMSKDAKQMGDRAQQTMRQGAQKTDDMANNMGNKVDNVAKNAKKSANNAAEKANNAANNAMNSARQ